MRRIPWLAILGGLALSCVPALVAEKDDMATVSLDFVLESFGNGSMFETDQLANKKSINPEPYRVRITYGTGTNQATFAYAERNPTLISLLAIVDLMEISRVTAQVTEVWIINRDTTNNLSLTGNFLTRLAGVTTGSESMWVQAGGQNRFTAPVTGKKYTVDASHALIGFDVSTSYDVLILGQE